MEKLTKQIHFRVSESMYNLLASMSKDKGCTVSYLCKVACRRILTMGGYYRNDR